MTRLYLCQVWFPPLSAKCFPALMWKWNRKQLLIRFSSRRISVKGLQPLRCELFHSRGCQIIGNPEHTQKPAQPSVKFQSEASSCYMSNCEKENFWPTFDCQAVCRMTLCSLRYRYKHKGETQRNTVVYLEFIEWEHRSYKCFRFHFRPRLTSELKFNFLNAKKRNNKCRKGGTTIWVSCFIIEQRFCSCIRRPVSTYKHICYFSRTITDDFEKQPQEYWSGVHSKICNRGASVRSYPIYMIT